MKVRPIFLYILFVFILVCSVVFYFYYSYLTDYQKYQDKIIKIEGGISIVQVIMDMIDNNFTSNDDNIKIYQNTQLLLNQIPDARYLMKKENIRLSNKSANEYINLATTQCNQSIDAAEKYGKTLSEMANNNDLSPKKLVALKDTANQFSYYRNNCYKNLTKASAALGSTTAINYIASHSEEFNN
jgi:cell division protein YceG involved in septum cleavage